MGSSEKGKKIFSFFLHILDMFLFHILVLSPCFPPYLLLYITLYMLLLSPVTPE